MGPKWPWPGWTCWRRRCWARRPRGARSCVSTRGSCTCRSSRGELHRVVLMLLDNLDPNLQSDAQSRRSPLHVAAQRGYLEICHLLLQAGANINAQDKLRRTPLLEAVANDHLGTARLLLQRGGCAYGKEEDGSTCLHHAAKNGNLEMVELLLATGQVDVNAQDNGGWTPIIWAAEHKHIEVIRRLLTRGADVTLTDNEENICLHWASFTGQRGDRGGSAERAVRPAGRELPRGHPPAHRGQGELPGLRHPVPVSRGRPGRSEQGGGFALGLDPRALGGLGGAAAHAEAAPGGAGAAAAHREDHQPGRGAGARERPHPLCERGGRGALSPGL
ncbi:hypothetical protein Q9966_016198 [Columba livia]|nr:hypothetical protein Q9966_016198 [Columba livia]